MNNANNPQMAASECHEVLMKLILAYPNLSGDAERCAEISRKVEAFTYQVAAQAVDEYVDKSGDQWLNLSRLLVVMDRVRKQHLELAASLDRRENAIKRQREEDEAATKRRHADALIAEMDDEILMGEWAKVRERYTGLAREWADKWTAQQVRTNLHFRQHVAETMVAA